jgi:adenine deaminase
MTTIRFTPQNQSNRALTKLMRGLDGYIEHTIAHDDNNIVVIVLPIKDNDVEAAFNLGAAIQHIVSFPHNI